MSNGEAKLDALRKRAEQLDSQIAAERLRQQKRAQKDRKRLTAIIGDALVEQADALPDLRRMLTQILGTAVTEPASRRFLETKGWI
jgi:hypothetical protein